jgi:hypothetical protein
MARQKQQSKAKAVVFAHGNRMLRIEVPKALPQQGQILALEKFSMDEIHYEKKDSEDLRLHLIIKVQAMGTNSQDVISDRLWQDTIRSENFDGYSLDAITELRSGGVKEIEFILVDVVPVTREEAQRIETELRRREDHYRAMAAWHNATEKAVKERKAKRALKKEA